MNLEKKAIAFIFAAGLFLFLGTEQSLAALKNPGQTCARGSECASGSCMEGYLGLVCRGKAAGETCSITEQALKCDEGLMCDGDTFVCVVDNRVSTPPTTNTSLPPNPNSSGGLCSAVGADRACVKTSDVNDPSSSCVSNKCTGGSDIKCCKMSSFKNPGIQTYPQLTSSGSGGNGNTPCDPSDKTKFCNPLRFNSVEEFLGGFLTALQRIIAVIALIMIVIGALQYITSFGGDQTKTAKKTITAALIGMAIAIAAPSFLKEISILLGWAPDNAAVAGALTLTQISMNVLNFLLSILGILALLMLVIAGIMYTTAVTDSKQAETGKNIAKYALLGVIVAMSSMVLLQQVAKFFIN